MTSTATTTGPTRRPRPDRIAPVTERVVVIDPSSPRYNEQPGRSATDDDVVEDEVEPTGFLAIDVGASRLAAGVVSPDGDVIVRDRVATPARNVWPALTQLVSRVLAANPGDVLPRACGVTCPGPIDRGTGAMKPVGLPIWHDFPIRREVGALTGLPVEVDTAGRALALAELWLGAIAERPKADQHLATMVLGDEVDGAYVMGGRMLEGLTGNLGQFGHIVVEPDGVPCPCGSTGCLMAYAGARNIEASTNRELRRTPAAIVERTGIMVARGCATIAAMLDVTDIVLGGVVPSVFGEPFFTALERELDQRSGLEHLSTIRVRGVGSTRIGPLVAAAAVALHRFPPEPADTAGPATADEAHAGGDAPADTGWRRPGG